jgi:hypothetical protein
VQQCIGGELDFSTRVFELDLDLDLDFRFRLDLE